MQDTIPYVGKNDRHTRNLQIKRDRRTSEAMGKARRTIDGGHLDPIDVDNILSIYTQDNTEEHLSNNLDTRNAVLQRINSGIVYAEYPLAPYSKREIRPIQS